MLYYNKTLLIPEKFTSQQYIKYKKCISFACCNMKVIKAH